MRYSFSGHESFHCKSLWLKKGYDFLSNNGQFADPMAVMELGVGKNMVSSIRFWLKALSLTKDDNLTPIADYLFADGEGRDPFCDDITTLWILHFLLVRTDIASIYSLLFTELQRERKTFSKDQIQSFIKIKCSVPEQKNVYNENTISKDINVLLQTYVAPSDLKQLERYSALLINLGLIKEVEKDIYHFQEIDGAVIPDAVLLYSLLSVRGDDAVLSFDKLTYLSLLFCVPITSFLERMRHLSDKYSNFIDYTDNSGIRNVIFKAYPKVTDVLDWNYHGI